MNSRVLYSAQYHRQHCTLQAIEQFGALYMHNHDDKYPSPLGFEPGPTFSYKLRYIVGFVLVEMANSTNPKPTIYRNLYENTGPSTSRLQAQVDTNKSSGDGSRFAPKQTRPNQLAPYFWQIAPPNSPHIYTNLPHIYASSPRPTRPTFIPTRSTYLPTRPNQLAPHLDQLAQHICQLTPANSPHIITIRPTFTPMSEYCFMSLLTYDT